MFEKLMNFLFKPEAEEDDDIKVVDEQERDEVEVTLNDFIKEENVNIKKEVVEEVSENNSEVKPEYKETVKNKSSLYIKADGPQEQDAKPKKKVRTLKREEYDLQPVISPFYGVKGEENASKKVEKKTAPIYKKETKKSEFSEVISPIYGIKEKKEEVKSFVQEEKKEEVKIPVPSSQYESIEEENLALDDIMSSKDGSEDDMIQFSLFGDDKRIQEEVFENEEIDNDDSLPF